MKPQPDDRELLLKATQLSARAIKAGTGGPFGALVARDGEVLGRGRNRVTCDNDPTAHAEVEAIRHACSTLKTFDLSGCTIYTSCEPCPMCLGAIYWARIDRVVYANTRLEAAAIDFDDADIYDQLALPLDRQRIASTHIPLDEAKEVFEQWRTSESKIEY